MKTETIAVFDIGKTNKKIMLFSKNLEVIHQQEEVFEEINDEDGFSCDDIEKVEAWIKDSLKQLLSDNRFVIKGVNFTTYGASLAYLDKQGNRLTPIYNYLKPMPEGVLQNFYEAWGGIDEFSRATASPAMGMLNSGLQVLWLKKIRPEVFSQVNDILHFPQYLSYLLTGKVTSEYTSIGCHTAMWNYDKHTYHSWLNAEGINLPQPIANQAVYETEGTKTGIGIHDSSASLVPYLKGSQEPFMLLSTGTWGIFMNPFNEEPLTAEQLRKDTLCYMSVNQKQVKSARLFMGHIHEVHAKLLAAHFAVDEKSYKNVATDKALLERLGYDPKGQRVFFSQGVPIDHIDNGVDLHSFQSYEEAYHQLMIDLTRVGMDTMQLAIPQNDQSKNVFISGGFARNDLFIKLLASWMPNKNVYTSEIDNATALGAAMIIYENAFESPLPDINLGLKQINAL